MFSNNLLKTTKELTQVNGNGNGNGNTSAHAQPISPSSNAPASIRDTQIKYIVKASNS